MTQPSTPSNPFPVPPGPWQPSGLPEQTGTTITTITLCPNGCGTEILPGDICCDNWVPAGWSR
ncbi:hypothetical protein O7627_24215 [Solwaraspora sp. WMMD1047]|uniref:hypothetical protein n=1 Tax=Solwaraspora sp. WMMD1047 TaxID=3016102 RepID=UPI00241661EE|nr:hypothetical protein [Solwaraspora sp. WMMD1047]MDG4832388.1 hypothetical protein [Solwaraspora sp. WMMD1047]